MAHYHISISAQRLSKSGWGDFQYAEGLRKSFKRFGHQACVFYAGEKPKLSGPDQIVLRIAGPHLEEPVDGALNLAWIISPPNLAPVGKLARFDHVFFCSRRLSKAFAARGIAGSFMPQATDTSHFHPEKACKDKPEIPITFVGNYASRVSRSLVFEAEKANLGLQVWGGGWKGHLPKRTLIGTHLNYDDLADVYARSKIILNAQMDRMSELGMMANRSFDALASGALVLSDTVNGFRDESLSGLFQVNQFASIQEGLKILSEEAALGLKTRLERHRDVAETYSFDARARQIDAIAHSLLEARATPTVEPVVKPRKKTGQTMQVDCTDYRPNAFQTPLDWYSDLKELIALAERCDVSLTLKLTPPERGFDDMPTLRVILETACALLRLSTVLSNRHHFKEVAIQMPDTHDEGEVHLLMADLREMQNLSIKTQCGETRTRQHALTTRAHIVIDTLTDSGSPFSFRGDEREQLWCLQRATQQIPLYSHSPVNFVRDRLKSHVRLWPRKQAVPVPRPIGVFLHLFYANLAEVFARRLNLIDAPMQLYISTDTEEKRQSIATHFPDADIRIFPNVGRDIYPKYFGFADAYEAHDIVLHLHGKKSPHSHNLDAWLAHILDCLLPSIQGVNRILSFFQTMPRLGLVSPIPFKEILPASHWGANFDLARELGHRLDLKSELPNNSDLVFPVGSMFWGRSAIVQKIASLKLEPHHFPPELGQTDGTLAHAIERMVGVVCAEDNYHQVSVADFTSNSFNAFGKIYDKNSDLREYLTKLSAR